VSTHRAPAFLEALAEELPARGTGPTHLPDEFELVRETFRRFAEDKIRPVAESVHRENLDIPESVIAGLAELGGFGLSVPEEYGGFALGGEQDYIGMVVATEELSWGSLGVGGSLITRPEILTRAIVQGGTEAQKQRWLPKIASGELMVGVMVTEPDFGSDVAGVKVTAAPVEGGYRINGVKTWCTFAARADVLMLLARISRHRHGHRIGLGDGGDALLARVAVALAGSAGKVLVIGHTDGADTRTARLPSAWHQSYEWASETVGVLARTLPPARLAAEGAADVDGGAAPAAPRRRVDIVLYP